MFLVSAFMLSSAKEEDSTFCTCYGSWSAWSDCLAVCSLDGQVYDPPPKVFLSGSHCFIDAGTRAGSNYSTELKPLVLRSCPENGGQKGWQNPFSEGIINNILIFLKEQSITRISRTKLLCSKKGTN